MMLSASRTVARAGSVVLSLSLLHAQRGGGDWVNAGNDAQRSNWLRTDGKISVASMSKPGFTQVWKMKLSAAARQLVSVTPPALIDFYIGYRGFRTLGFFGTPGKIVGVDTDLARLEWEHPVDTGKATGDVLCPGGVTSAVARPVSTAFPRAGAAGFGRGGGAKSAVGKPGEGAVTIRTVQQRQGPPPGPPPTPAAGANRRATPPPNPFGRSPQFIYSIAPDGNLHAMYISNGEEPKASIPFIPAGAYSKGLIFFDSTAYVATTHGCNGAENGLWALDMETQKVAHWKSPGDVAGTMALSADPDGNIYVASGSEIFTLEALTLKQKNSVNAGSATFTSTPVPFEFQGKTMLAATTNDGKLHVFEAATLKPAATSAAFSDAGFQARAVSSWQDASGTRWILAPAAGKLAAGLGAASNGPVLKGAIVAFKLVDKGGALTLEPGWVSRDMATPIAPAIVNGVVFAVASGEFRTTDPKVPAATRALKSTRAVLHAFDGATGKPLWNSGAAITSFVTSGGLSAGGGRVYVSGWDGTQYAFGFPMEH